MQGKSLGNKKKSARSILDDIESGLNGGGYGGNDISAILDRAKPASKKSPSKSSLRQSFDYEVDDDADMNGGGGYGNVS